MRILVFGAGAVGQALGGVLAACGNEVDLIVRPRLTAGLRAHGLSVDGLFGDFRVAPDRLGVFTDISELPGEKYQYVLLTAKSYDTDEAISELVKLRETPDFVVSMQNGCGNVEKVAAEFGEDRTLGARVITGFMLTGTARVTITVSQDAIHIGGCRDGDVSPEAADVLAREIARAGIPCVATAVLHRDLYAKLLYNCALNPLGAALGVHYGALADNPNSRLIMDAIVTETFAVLDAMGAKTHWQTGADYLRFFYEKQVPSTYEHRSSMLQDLEAGKRTEIDALTGYVAEMGRKSGVDTPYCLAMTAIVRFLEQQGMRKPMPH